VFTYQKKDQKAPESIAIKSDSVSAAVLASTFHAIFHKTVGSRKSVHLSKEFKSEVATVSAFEGDHYVRTHKAWCSYYGVPYHRTVRTYVQQLCSAKNRCLGELSKMDFFLCWEER
jgi:hypothetical protein